MEGRAVKVMVIGGSKHGEWIEIFDGSRVWINLLDASSHVIRTLHSSITDVSTGAVVEAYTLRVAVHPDMVGPNEPVIVQQVLTAMAMNAFAREHGEREEIPKEPSPDIVRPDR